MDGLAIESWFTVTIGSWVELQEEVAVNELRSARLPVRVTPSVGREVPSGIYDLQGMMAAWNLRTLEP